MTSPQVAVYAGSGYYYPTDDVGRLSDEIRRLRDLGYHRIKIKIGGTPLLQDLKRIEAAARLLPDASHLAVDAIYSYAPTSRIEAAEALAPLGLWWFEDICDPLDFVPIETGGHP
jgi:L-alanine-DL-glutamate epimerase-like enolase superfamily enzyme